jgi:hypothetical protein
MKEIYKTHIDIGINVSESFLEIECLSEEDKIFLENIYKLEDIRLIPDFNNLKTKWFLNIWLKTGEFSSIQFFSESIARQVLKYTDHFGTNIKLIEILRKGN